MTKSEAEMVKVFKQLPKERKESLLAALDEFSARESVSVTKPDLMSDAELCEMLNISRVTLRKHLRVGPPKKLHPSTLDIRMLRPVIIGKQRRWNRVNVIAFLNGKA